VRLAVAGLAAIALCCDAATAATVDPVAIVLQQALKQALQGNLKTQVPGMKVTTVRCKATKSGTKGTCRANFVYKTIRGYYVLKVVHPPGEDVSYTSTSFHCFDRKSGKAVSC
jgi:hypothetical protein